MSSPLHRCLAVLVALIAVVAVRADYMSPVGGTKGSSQPVCYSHWQSVGPFAVTHLYTGINEIQDPEDIGAAHEIWVNGDIAYLASANGGLWKTTTFHTYNSFNGPHWVPQTDQLPCSSMHTVSGSIDSTDVVAGGCGFPSNSAQRGGEPRGVMLTLDGGATWAMTGFPPGYWVTSVLLSGQSVSTRIVVGAKVRAEGFYSGTTGQSVDPYNIGSSKGGIWLSTDAGATFTQKSTLPINKIVRHPQATSQMYASNLGSADSGAFPATIQVSADGGASWSATTAQPDIASSCSGRTKIVNSQVSVAVSGGTTYLYAGYYLTIDVGTNPPPCYCFFRSTDGGASWTEIAGKPAQAGGLTLGIQGIGNFAVYACPVSAQIMFVAGTGRVVFRVDTSLATPTWTVISSPELTADKPDYTTTKSKTAPHSDARTFAWDSTTSELLLTNDGGVYRRSSPLASPELGDWTSLAGDMAITEAYQVSTDGASGAMIVAAQDNSLMLSQFDGTEKDTGIWNFLLTGDGTSCGIDFSSKPISFYGADQFLFGWFKTPLLANSGGIGVNSAATTFSPQFGTCTPGSPCLSFSAMQAVNSVDPEQVLICTVTEAAEAASKCYQAQFGYNLQQVNVLEFSTKEQQLGDSIVGTYVFGGQRNGVSNFDVVMAVGLTFVWARDKPCSTSSGDSSCISSYSSGAPSNPNNSINKNPPWKNSFSNVFLAQHPRDYYINCVTDDAGHTWLTTNFGQTWIDMNSPSNSNLLSLSGHTTIDTTLTGAVIFVNVSINGVYPLIIGTPYGAFVTFNDPTTSSMFTFVQLGANLAKTIPTSFVYSAASDTLSVSTFGRGVFQLQSASSVLADAAKGTTTTNLNPSCKVPLYPNVAGAYGYRSDGTNPPSIGFPGSTPTVVVSGVPASVVVGQSFTMKVYLTVAPAAGTTNSVQFLPSTGSTSPFIVAFNVNNWSTPQSVTFTAGTDAIAVSLQVKVSADMSTAGFKDVTVNFIIVQQGTGGGSSSSSSSTGTSSGGGSTGVAQSSTGTVGPVYIVPSSYPAFMFVMKLNYANLTLGSVDVLRAMIGSDFGYISGVNPSRIMLTSVTDLGQNVAASIQFCITPGLNVGEIGASQAGEALLTSLANPNSTFYSLPTGSQVVANSFSQTPLLSAASLLKQVSFKMNYDILNLPGNDVRSFSSLIIADLAVASGVTMSRIVVLSVLQGSVVTKFTVAPSLISSESSQDSSLSTFVTAANNPSSSLFNGSYTKNTVSGSAEISSTSSINGGSVDTGSSSGFWTNTNIIAIACGLGGGILLLLICVCCMCSKSDAPKDDKKKPVASPTKAAAAPATAAAKSSGNPTLSEAEDESEPLQPKSKTVSSDESLNGRSSAAPQAHPSAVELTEIQVIESKPAAKPAASAPPAAAASASTSNNKNNATTAAKPPTKSDSPGTKPSASPASPSIGEASPRPPALLISASSQSHIEPCAPPNSTLGQQEAIQPQEEPEGSPIAKPSHASSSSYQPVSTQEEVEYVPGKHQAAAGAAAPGSPTKTFRIRFTKPVGSAARRAMSPKVGVAPQQHPQP